MSSDMHWTFPEAYILWTDNHTKYKYNVKFYKTHNKYEWVARYIQNYVLSLDSWTVGIVIKYQFILKDIQPNSAPICLHHIVHYIFDSKTKIEFE